MDPRRLDSIRIKNILNCEPPSLTLSEPVDKKPVIEPVPIPIIEAKPKPAEPSQQNNFEHFMCRLLKERQTGKLNPETQQSLMSMLPFVPEKCSIYMDINIYVVEDKDEENEQPVEIKSAPEETKKPINVIPKFQLSAQIPLPMQPLVKPLKPISLEKPIPQTPQPPQQPQQPIQPPIQPVLKIPKETSMLPLAIPKPLASVKQQPTAPVVMQINPKMETPQEFKSTKIFIPNFNNEFRDRISEAKEPVLKMNKVIPEPTRFTNNCPDLIKRTFNEDVEDDGKCLNNLLQKIKFFWRGTNQSYPYSFKKRYYMYYTDTGEFCYTEAIDHSKKVIPNQSEPPSDFYYA